MNTIHKALEVIARAEAELRELISESLAKQRYGDVREIAQLADRLAHLSPSREPQFLGQPVGGGVPIKELSGEPVRSKRKPAERKKQAVVARGRKRSYPRFVRDGERLVKIGWSKKNRQEYEHRVPLSGVQGLVRHLAGSVKADKVFDIESLLPITDSGGVEVPGYQVYVVIAWLREAGLIQRKGRDGYVLSDPEHLAGRVDDLWNAIEAK